MDEQQVRMYEFKNNILDMRSKPKARGSRSMHHVPNPQGKNRITPQRLVQQAGAGNIDLKIYSLLSTKNQ